MKINFIPQQSFKSCVPVEFYMRRNENDDKFERVYYSTENNNLSRCQKEVIKTLNGKHNNPNTTFLDFYKFFDKQYARYTEHPKARSVYDKANSKVYLITGNDVKEISNMARDIGIAKSQEKAKNPHTTSKLSSEHIANVTNDYYCNAYSYISKRRLKNEQGNPLIMKVYLNAKCDKNNKVKNFSIAGAKLVKDI